MTNEEANKIHINEEYNRIYVGLHSAANQVKRTWLSSDYPESMRSDFAQFRHALTHIHKAAGKLSAIVDHIEHERDTLEKEEAVTEIPKLLADLIRCAIKIAEVEKIDIAEIYVERIKQLAFRWGHK